MAKNYDVAREVMTVQQVMDEIGARAPSTITRLIKAKRLRATKVGAMGWLVYRDSVAEFLESERKTGKTVGFPRGGIRSKDAEQKPAKPPKPSKKARRG